MFADCPENDSAAVSRRAAKWQARDPNGPGTLEDEETMETTLTGGKEDQKWTVWNELLCWRANARQCCGLVGFSKSGEGSC